MRTRIFSDTPVSTGTFRHFEDKLNEVNGTHSWEHDWQVPYTKKHVYSGMMDVVSENFKLRSARGEIINNPMLSVLRTYETVPATFVSKGYYSDGDFVTYMDGVVLPPNYSDLQSLNWDVWHNYLYSLQSERDIAVTQAWASVELSEAAALASLGEMPETVRWLGSIVNRFYNLIKLFSYKRGLRNSLRWVAKSDKKDAIDNVSDFWLEFRYAFRPLAFEAKQCLEALQATIGKNSRSTARGWNEKQSSSNSTLNISTNDGLGYCVVSRARSISSNYRAGVLFTIDSDINGLLSLWGVDQPFEAIWELTPFSFIIDWFFNIGNIISSWTPNASLHPLTSWITEEHLIETYDSTDGFHYPNYYWIDGHFESVSPGYTRTKVLVKRRLPSPSRAVLPTFNMKLDVAKITDLLLISRKLFNSKMR